MTMEQRILLDLNDIIGIEYSCVHCHAHYLVPIKGFSRVIYQCPNCKEGLVSGAHTQSGKVSNDSAIHHFVDALVELRDRGMDIRLEITSESAASRDSGDGT